MTLQEQVDFFLKNGYLIIPNVISEEELKPLQELSHQLLNSEPPKGHEKDYQYGAPGADGKAPLRRIEYMLGKGDPFLMLLAHPKVLQVVTALIGKEIVPTWDSMVVKVPYQGVEVKWHRDVPNDHRLPVFNVDFYLDDATPENGCLRVLPGTQSGPNLDMSARNNASEYDFPGSVQAPMKAGDVLIHNVMVYHGSPINHSPALRRVLYYEYRALDTLLDQKNFPEEWIRERLKLLQKAIAARANSDYLKDTLSYEYKPREGWSYEESEYQSLNPRVPHPGWDQPVGAK